MYDSSLNGEAGSKIHIPQVIFLLAQSPWWRERYAAALKAQMIDVFAPEFHPTSLPIVWPEKSPELVVLCCTIITPREQILITEIKERGWPLVICADLTDNEIRSFFYADTMIDSIDPGLPPELLLVKLQAALAIIQQRKMHHS